MDFKKDEDPRTKTLVMRKVYDVYESQFHTFTPRLTGFIGMYCLTDDRPWNLIVASSSTAVSQLVRVIKLSKLSWQMVYDGPNFAKSIVSRRTSWDKGGGILISSPIIFDGWKLIFWHTKAHVGSQLSNSDLGPFVIFLVPSPVLHTCWFLLQCHQWRRGQILPQVSQRWYW